MSWSGSLALGSSDDMGACIDEGLYSGQFGLAHGTKCEFAAEKVFQIVNEYLMQVLSENIYDLVHELEALV